jgi:Tfp pilus assembly protein PilV
MNPRHRLVHQEGVAMVVVMGALLVISLSAGVLAATASQTNQSAIRDSNSKAALAAAEAGLQVGTQRFEVKRTQLASNQCLAGSGGVTPTTMATGQTDCAAVVGGSDVADGATYSYVISPPGAPCRARPNAVTAPTGNDRCITSTGTVNGVARRIQARLGSIPSPPFFALAGIVGLDSLTFVNSVDIDTTVGSNGLISLGNSVHVNGDAYLGPTATVEIDAGSTLDGSQVRRSDPWTLVLTDFEPLEATPPNHNNLLVGKSYYNAGGGKPIFNLPTGTQTLPVAASGVTNYYFCSFTVGDSVDLRIPAGREVRIYVDSPTRPGSPCTSGGTVQFDNSVCVNIPSCNKDAPGMASNLEFHIAGTGGQDLHFNNSVQVAALFYAPNSKVQINNSILLVGGLAAAEVTIVNSINYVWPMDVRSDPGPGSRTDWSGWFECRPKPSVASDPESGC